MLFPYMGRVAQLRVVLASGSPRRREILANLGLNFEVAVSNFDERTMDKAAFPSPAEYVKANATNKAMEVALRLLANSVGHPEVQIPHLLIGSDTVVVLDGKILEKPLDESDAHKMLSSLSGRAHDVFTGVSLIVPRPRGDSNAEPLVRAFAERTEVQFATLSSDLIHAYIATGDPMDKAGAYGIQGAAGSFVRGVNGDYFNVMGFPQHRFAAELVSLLEDKIL
eukprot:tig00000692_g3267.t1